MSRLPLKPSVVKRLFALSGNICAYPDCKKNLIDASGLIIGEICHIEAAEPNGQRFNYSSNDEYRRSFENLLLLCSNHHKETNDINKYPVAKLIKYKLEHESKFLNNSFTISDHVVEQAIENYMKQENKNDKFGTQINNQAATQNIGTQIGTQTIHNYSNDDKSINLNILKGTRKVIPELKHLIDSNRKPASPPDVTVIDYQNELQDKTPRDVELIPTRFLKFRKGNGRIKTDLESYEKHNNIELKEEDDSTQAILKGFLLKSDPEKNEKLKRQLFKKGQQHPAIITCDGFLINGNRRKLILEELFAENDQNPMFESMRVVILPDNVLELDIRKIENRYQLQDEGKSEYSGINRALTLRDNINSNYDLRSQLRDDPEYSHLDEKDFEKAVKKIERDFLKPLECVDRYLELFDRQKLYDTVSESIGDREGRWQAFLDYSNFYHGTLINKSLQTQFNINDTEVRKIENAVYKIIRKRSLNSAELESTIGKVHDFVRKLPKYVSNQNAKKHLLKIADSVKEDIPKELQYDKEGNKYDEREIDEKWGNHFRKEILGNLIQAHKIVVNQQERDKPLDLLEDALKKLKHDNLKIENMDSSYYSMAMDLTNKIISQSELIYKAIDKARYNLKKLSKKKNN